MRFFSFLSLLTLLLLAAPARAQFTGGFGSGATASDYGGGAAMPLTLLTFDARPADGAVQLRWTTVDEINTDHFLVERTRDGRTFSPAGMLAAAGNAPRGTELAYTLADATPLPGTSFYRLKSVDIDGSFTYSDLVEVNRGGGDAPLAFTVRPNPSTGNTVGVEMTALAAGEPVLLEVLDAAGRTLATRDLRATAGDYLQVPLRDRLPAGTYLLRLSQPSTGAQSTRLIVGKR